jgi:pimeloyl-ACP methyl ester carboxylesterase
MSTEGDDPIRCEGATFSTRSVDVDEGVSLRVLTWDPGERADAPPLVFVSGWVSAVEGWASLLRALSRRRVVHYVESREKSSATIVRRRVGPEDFSIDRLAADLVEATRVLGVDHGESLLVGSSMGATSVLEGLKAGRLGARGAFLIAPNTEFRFPFWGHAVVHLPAASYHVIKHVVLWYLRTFRVDARKEPEQMARYDRTLRAAHPQRIKLSAMAVRGFEIWPRLETVAAPVAVAWAPTDTLHDETSVERLLGALPRSTPVRCPSNLYMHRDDLVPDIERFEASLGRAE